MTRYLSVAVIVLVLLATQWEERITIDVDLVNVYFNVCNRKGRLISQLNRDNFAVFEDGTPQVITNFSREADVPIAMAILMDTSGSVREKLHFEQEAVIEFLDAALRRQGDKAAILTFDHTIELRQDYTNDTALLANAVRNTRAGGGTRLYDALHFVVTQQFKGNEERQVLVVVTDGDDKSSRHSPTEVMELAQRNNVIIYSISVNAVGTSSDMSRPFDRILETIATETGGIALFPKQLRKLPANFKLIDEELHSQYSLAYRSTNPNRDGTFRRIKIEAKDPQYSIRTRSGYYAPHDASASATAQKR